MPHSNNPVFAERYPIALGAGVVDFGLIFASSYFAHYLRFGSLQMNEWYLMATFTITLLIVIAQIATRCYATWRGQGLLRPISRVLFAWAVSIGIIFIALVLVKMGHYYSRIWLTSFLVIAFTLVFSGKILLYVLLRQARLKGKNLKQVLVLTDPGHNHNVFQRKESLRHDGYEIADTLAIDAQSFDVSALAKEIQNRTAHEIWICLPLSQSALIQSIVYSLQNHMADIRYLPDLSDLPLLNHRFNVVGNMQTIDISCSAMDAPNRFLKRAEDLILGTLFTLLLLPAAALIFVLVRLSSPGPAIFKQYRTGVNGKEFKVYKFRTMKIHQEAAGKVTQATENDPRITPIGAFLRRTSLDEIPQFFNVLQGRMSIVGPRPHALAHNEYYKELVESYMRRHKVKPGITGWAQVNGYRGETDTLDKMQKRVEYDLWYINNWSLWLDIKIIFLTIFKGIYTKQP